MTVPATAKPATGVRRLAKKEYLAFEELVASTAEGRAFLRARDSMARVIATEKVRRMMQEIMPHLGQPPRASAVEHVRILRKELQEISAHIMQTRNEISALRPDQQGNSRIYLATSELDSIVSTTERATYDILNGAERIQAAAQKLPDSAEVAPLAKEIGSQATEIMTACSFQDLTGQRITKVVNALRYIETRINAMIDIWGIEEGARKDDAAKADDTRPDAHLLNGPQNDAADQSEIDSLFEAAPSPAATPSAPADQNTIDSLFK
jgi:chemotaxis regulatin CheY-phosphate phosphatase CheZ